MALPGPTQFQKRQAARRRTGDITRLAQTYAQNVEALTQDYERAFGQFTQQREAQLAPYEQAVAQYQSAFDVYQQQAQGYQQRLNAFQQASQGYLDYRSAFFFADQSNQVTQGIRLPNRSFSSGSGSWLDQYTLQVPASETWSQDYQFVQTGTRPINYWQTVIVEDSYLKYDPISHGYISVPWVYSKDVQMRRDYETGYLKQRLPSGEFTTKTPEQFQYRTDPGKFTETAPVAPVAPEAPQLSEFDASQFEARRAQLESEFQRELGERRGARLSAVSRRQARPLLQGQSA